MILPENPMISAVRNNLDKEREIFLVGGSVRDILLENTIMDYDFVVEGDVSSLAGQVAADLGIKLTLNKKLLTASIHSFWGRVDFATARKEYYNYPGAMPTVSPAGISEDVKRRDFTINTLLRPLFKTGWGDIIDTLGGCDDLKQGLIRFLHKNSFRDDPTRILRAIRFKNRFGFKLEKETQIYLQRDWPVLSGVSPARRLKEWILLCEEDNPGSILEDIRDLGGWGSFLGSIPYERGVISFISDFPGQKDTNKMRRWYFCLLALLIGSPRSLEHIAHYWGINKRDKESLGRTINSLADLNRSSANRRKVWSIIKTLPLESAYYIYKLNNWDLSWKEFQISIKEYSLPVNGDDLQKLGIKPGQQLGEILSYLEELYREGAFDTKAEAMRLAKKKLEEGCV